jgi:hypothetical protein
MLRYNIANRSFENMAEVKYLGIIVTDRNLIQEEIKKRLNLGNADYRSVQNHLCYSPLSENLKIKIYTLLSFPVILYGCETLSLTLREH